MFHRRIAYKQQMLGLLPYNSIIGCTVSLLMYNQLVPYVVVECSLRERVGCGRFEHRHMKNWMDRAYKLWETV